MPADVMVVPPRRESRFECAAAYLVALVAVLAPPALVVALFSQMSPYALDVLDALKDYPPSVGYGISAVAVLMALCLLYVDGGRLEDPCARLSAICTSVVVAVAACFCFQAYPFLAPAAVTLLSGVLLQATLGCFKQDPEQGFKKAMFTFFLAAILFAFLWLQWMAGRLSNHRVEKWSDWTDEFRERVRGERLKWKIAAVEWLVPLAVAVELAVMGLLCWFQLVQVQIMQGSQAALPADGFTADQIYLVSQVKLLALCACVTAMALWIGASFDATGANDLGHERADLRDEVLTLTFAFFGGLTFWLVYRLGFTKVQKAAENSKVAARVLEAAQGDWAKAVYIFCAWPFLAIAKICGHPKSQSFALGSTPTLTNSAVVHWARFTLEAWSTPIFIKAQYLGIGYVCFEVGIKATLVCLAYTNEVLSSLPVFAVSAAIFAVGTFLFLLPPTPGPPVYAIIGVVVTASALNDKWEPQWAVAWAVAVGFAVKMVFAATAQKFIGEPLAKSVRVRSLVQVHTTEIRAIELILREPGISAAKVSILIGGPDWPVAVLCGILRLPLLQVMLGLSPVLFQSVIPCILSGAFLVIFAGDEKKKALGETVVAVAGGLQIVALVVAGYYVQKMIEDKFEELQTKRPEDDDIRKLEEESEAKAEVFQDVTTFEKLPCKVKGYLLGGLTFAWLACALLAGPWERVFKAEAFREFEITSSVEDALDGNALNVVQPLGWAAIALCSGACLLLLLFNSWAASKVAEPAAYRNLVDTTKTPAPATPVGGAGGM